MPPALHELSLSGSRFTVLYHLHGGRDTARAMAEDICFEQTVEFPPDLVPAGGVRDHVVGRVERFDEIGPKTFAAHISFAEETVGSELTQLLNVLFGNISLKPGIRLVDFTLTEDLMARFHGPRFGVRGLRERLGVGERPLLCTALKPMGLSPERLASLARDFALGGIDVIKDDHGLADQGFCPFDGRVARCAEAVARANDETGLRSIYVPNVTAPGEVLFQRIARAQHAGAGGLLMAPGLLGLDTMRRNADDNRLDLPILSHPALLGGFVTSARSGMSHAVLFGKLQRLAGADATIFPHSGGRFSFTPEVCRSLARACHSPLGELRPIFPVPAGGMTLERVPEILDFYGRDVMLLIGGDLHRHGDLVRTCERFRKLVD